MQKARRQETRKPKSRPPSDRLLAHGFRIYFTRHQAYFSPFPHGTSALSVTEEYLALGGGPPSFPAGFSRVPAVLGIPLGAVDGRVPGYHRLWRAFPCRFGLVSCSHVAVPQPRRSKLHRFGLAPVSLAATKGIAVAFLFHRILRCFSSPGFAPVLRRVIRLAGGPGFPIRTSWAQRLCAAPPGLSQLTTSFIASLCQGIHRAPYCA